MRPSICLQQAGKAWLACAALAFAMPTAGVWFSRTAGAAPVSAAPATQPAKAVAPADDMDNAPAMRRRKMSETELNRLRMLEIQSGAFHEAHKEATALALVGPPLSDREKALHAVNRLAFGPRPGQVQDILQKGTTDPYLVWAKEQLEPDKIDDKEVESIIAQRFPWTTMSIEQLKKTYPYKGEGEKDWSTVRDGLPQIVLTRAALSKREFKEVMCEFWREHFCVDNSPNEPNKLRTWAAVRYEDDVIRKHAFGKFKDMLFASATHPAMLEYLDNSISRAHAWNENYAREVMELHTLGVDHGYNNYDVQELSKVLTGWTYDMRYNFTFKEGEHEPGPKKVLGVQIEPGYSGGEKALYMLATHPNTATFIAKKLCVYLVNDAPSDAYVKKIAAVFTSSGGDLPKVYSAIITSPEFVSRENYRAKFKTPFEFVVSSIRATDAKVDSAVTTCKELAKMGEQIYNCPDPTGYYDRAESWMDSGVLTSRWDYSLQMLRGGISGIKPSDEFVGHYKAMKPDEQLKSMVKELIGDDVGDRTRLTLVKAASENDQPRMIAVLLGSPSFQQQ